jgi:TadE-like protein
MTELALQIPLMLLLLFGGVELGRVFYIYHTLQKAVRNGAGLLARSGNVNYCPADEFSTSNAAMDARNFIVYGNLQGAGTPVVPGFETGMIQVFAERSTADILEACSCPGAPAANSCDVTNGGRAPDFIVVNLGDGFPLRIPFPFVSLGTINLKVSVRMPVTGG